MPFLSIRITEELRRQLKVSCAERGVSVTEVVTGLIARDLEEHERAKAKGRVAEPPSHKPKK